MARMLVDSHAHVFLKDLNMTSNRRYTPNMDAPVTQYLTMLGHIGFDRAVLVQPSFLGTDNSYMVDILRQYPAKMRGVAVVAPTVSMEELDVLEQAGVTGIRLNMVGQQYPDLASSQWDEVLQAVVCKNWHVEIHSYAQDLRVFTEPLLERNCNIVVDHFGYPDAVLGAKDPGFRSMLDLAQTGKVWVKVSAAYRVVHGAADQDRQIRTLFDALLAEFTADRLMWGTDWPHTGYSEMLSYEGLFRDFCKLVRREEDLMKILSDTPKVFFKFS